MHSLRSRVDRQGYVSLDWSVSSRSELVYVLAMGLLVGPASVHLLCSSSTTRHCSGEYWIIGL